MMRLLASIAIVAVLCLSQVSCRQPPDVVYKAAVGRAQTLAEKGETKKAVAELRRLFDKRRFKAFQPDLLTGMLQIHLNAGDAAGAQGLFREVAGRNAPLAGGAINLLADYYVNHGRYEELAAWCRSLRTYRFDEASTVKLAAIHFRALDITGKSVEIPVALVSYLVRLEPAAALNLAQTQFAARLGSGQVEGARQILGVVEKAVKDSPMRRGALLGMNVDLLLKHDRQAADGMVRGVVGKVPDDSVVRNVTAVAQAHAAAGDMDAADILVQSVMESARSRPSVREPLAGLWIRFAERRGSTAELVNRLAALKAAGFAAPFLLDQIDGVYAMLLGRGQTADFESLYRLCDELRAAKNDAVTERRLVGVMLDVGFYLKKFEEALVLVESGLGTEDAVQKAMLVDKIKAHIALQKGQPREAVAHFRDFMAKVAQGTGPELDPVDNSRTTKDMILGLNAKRIGDILKDAGDRAEAAKAYAEARDHYLKALAEFADPKSVEHQKIRKQMAEIPAN